MQENVQNWNCGSRHQWASRYFSLSLRSQRIDAFELWCCIRLLRVPWTARRFNQSIVKEISPEYSIGRTDPEAETPILWPPDVKN